MLGSKIRFEGLRGVGTVELDLQENQRVYTLIGPNGVGKTKTLEGLFQTLFVSNEAVAEKYFWQSGFCSEPDRSQPVKKLIWLFEKIILDTQTLTHFALWTPERQHRYPVILLGSQSRSSIRSAGTVQAIAGSFSDRKSSYLVKQYEKMFDDNGLSHLNMDTDIEGWFVTLAQSANPYQKQEDNREVEIKTVLKLLHEIDGKIDPQFLEIAGDGRVSLKIDGQKRELSHLSTGFASILKMLQAIVSGYGYFTNEVQLQNVRGIVLIDEIESHLHLSWQSHIIPLFKRLFPNTTFYITTHSPIVLTQLNEGEAYRLERDADGVVRTHLIHAPNRAAMVDVLQEAFDVDLNRIKQDSSSPESQKAAKQQLLNLLKAQWGDA